MPNQPVDERAVICIWDLSPFERVPQIPAAGLNMLPMFAITALAAATILAGLGGLRLRDFGRV